MRRPSGGTGIPRPSSAPVENITASSTETTITLPLRRSLKQADDKGKQSQDIYCNRKICFYKGYNTNVLLYIR